MEATATATAIVVAKAEHEKFCMDCGQAINKNAEICPKCGIRQMPAPITLYNPQPVVPANGRSRQTAGLLSIFLGSFGAHKFYLGQAGVGVLYLLFMWTFLPLIVGLIEGVHLLNMSDQEFNAKHGPQ